MSIRQTKCPVGGQTKGTSTALFQKTIKLSLVGNDKNEINEVAKAIHSFNHPLIIGTRHKRKVTVTSIHSSDTTKIFDGKIKPINELN